MRLKIYLLLVTLCMAIPSFADDELQVTANNLSAFNDPNATATVIFDYSNLKIEGTQYEQYLKEHGEDYVRDWPIQNKECEDVFIQQWNKSNSKGLKVDAEKGKPYTMRFEVTDLDLGNVAAALVIGFGAGGAKMSGTMYLYKGDSQTPELTVKITGQTGHSKYTETKRRKDLYKELAQDLVKEIKNTKSKK